MTPLGLVAASMWKRFFERIQTVPEPFPAAQHDRYHDDVQIVDQVGGQESRMVGSGRQGVDWRRVRSYLR